MEFNQKKLPQEAASKLIPCPISSVKPYALMLAPVYVYLKINAKFVSVKGPLDFFTEADLSRLAPLETFFFPRFVESVIPFRQAARRVRAILNWNPEASYTMSGQMLKVAVPPAPFEISDAIIRIIGSLWDPKLTVEPFFAAVFANELCDLMPPELLCSVRDKDVRVFEHAVQVSGVATFLALHLGYCDWDFLNRFRQDCFENVAGVGARGLLDHPEWGSIFKLAQEVMNDTSRPVINGTAIGEMPSRTAQKIAGRLKRVSEKFILPEVPTPTIYGERGFRDG